MIRSLLVFTVLVLFPLSGQAQSPEPQTQPGPRAHIAQNVYQFPPTAEGTVVVHDFMVSNQGDAPLEILQVKSG